MRQSDDEADLDRHREAFRRDRMALVRSQGPETFDQAQALYRDAATGEVVVVRDAFPGVSPAGPVEAFIERLRMAWWRARRQFRGDGELRPLAGLYARFLPEVGFDYVVEFRADPAAPDADDHAGPVCCWRVDARGRATKLRPPADEGEFHDMTGTFFDLRAGWRWLVAAHRAAGELAVAEVQAGYLIGARAGVPGDPDPASREDPALAAALSAWDRRGYDALEFLAGPVAERYPFPGERYGEWLDEPATAAVEAGQTELFVLADSTAFIDCVQDLCGHREIDLALGGDEDDPRLVFSKGPLRVDRPLSYPFLRALHTGRTFIEGTRLFFSPTIDALDDAHELWLVAKARIEDHALSVEDGDVLIARDAAGQIVARVNLLGLVGGRQRRGQAGADELLRLLGYDARLGRFVLRGGRLDRCPISGDPAVVGKVIRPLALLGVDPRTLAGVVVGQHLVCYTLDGPEWSTPIEPKPGRTIADLEAAWRAGLEAAPAELLDAGTLGDDAVLLVGREAGSFVLEPGRVRAALAAMGDEDGGARFAYAFFADALVVARGKLTGAALHRARLAALEAVQARFPDRTWPLDVARPIDLDGPTVGRVELAR
ncbi:MAG: hypothetical protein KC620_04050 [Myxococcales bacterium]|nr:hypothetical protein [Myxococcales bacterium]